MELPPMIPAGAQYPQSGYSPLPPLGYTPYEPKYEAGTRLRLPGSGATYVERDGGRFPILTPTRSAKYAPGIMPHRSLAPKHGKEAIEFWRHHRPDIFIRPRSVRQGSDPPVIKGQRGAAYSWLFAAHKAVAPIVATQEERRREFERNLRLRIEPMPRPHTITPPQMIAPEIRPVSPTPPSVASFPRVRAERVENARLRRLGIR